MIFSVKKPDTARFKAALISHVRGVIMSMVPENEYLNY